MASERKLIEIPAEYLPAPAELPGDLGMLATEIEEVWPGYGVRVAIVLAQLFPGIPIYLRNVNHLIRRMRDDAIRAEYDNGGKVRELAIKNKLSTRQIEHILSQAPSQEELKKKQVRLF